MSYVLPANISKEYYSFQAYNSKQRLLTYWYQISESLELNPKSMLEVGLGTGLVTSYLRNCGIPVKTFDINTKLKPDYNCSILDSDKLHSVGKYDLVLCSRVLHHINYNEIDLALQNLSSLSNGHVLMTLPVDELRMYFMTRYTSSSIKTLSLKIPNFIKKTMTKLLKRDIGSGLWQINSSSDTSKSKLKSLIEEHFIISKSYQIPEDSSHMLYVLKKK